MPIVYDDKCSTIYFFMLELCQTTIIYVPHGLITVFEL